MIFLKIYLNPYYRPIIGFRCKHTSKEKHSPDCDAELHDCLDTIANALFYPDNGQRTENDERELWRAFGYIRTRLLLSGAKIP